MSRWSPDAGDGGGGELLAQGLDISTHGYAPTSSIAAGICLVAALAVGMTFERLLKPVTPTPV
jgi:hypothetical protein